MDDTDFRLDAANHYAVLDLRRPIGDSLRNGLAKAAGAQDLGTLLIVASADEPEPPWKTRSNGRSFPILSPTAASGKRRLCLMPMMATPSSVSC